MDRLTRTATRTDYECVALERVHRTRRRTRRPIEVSWDFGNAGMGECGRSFQLRDACKDRLGQKITEKIKVGH